MVSFKETVILINGPLYGLTMSLIDYFESLRRELLQPKMRIFIQTWDLDYNVEIIEAANKYIDKCDYVRLELDVHVGWYNELNLIKACKTLNNGIGYKGSDVPSALGKRMWFFYTLVNGCKRIKTYNPDAFVMRFEPNTKWLPKSGVSIPIWIASGSLRTKFRHFNGSGEIRRNNLPIGAKVAPSDMFYTNVFYDEAVGERYFWSSVKSLEAMFGKDFKMQEFLKRYISIFNHFKSTSDINIELVNKNTVNNAFHEYDVVPHEAAQYLYRFIRDSKTYIPVVGFPTVFGRAFHDLRNYNNPWIDIDKNGRMEIPHPFSINQPELSDKKDELVRIKTSTI